MEPQVVYLTGAPATGKSTLARLLGDSYGFLVLSYGELLTQQLAHVVADQVELRERSAEVISTQQIVDLDAHLASRVTEAVTRGQSVVIDSHAVTAERYGFRVIPYQPAGLVGMKITHLVCLYASTSELQRRVGLDAGGRRLLVEGELERHSRLQESLTLAYSHTLGVPAYFVDADDGEASVAAEVASLLLLGR
jgi:adenylate kinase